MLVTQIRLQWNILGHHTIHHTRNWYGGIFADVIVYLAFAVAVYMNWMQKLKELIKLKLSNICNFQLFASNIEGNISHQKLRICWVAKKLMSHTSSVKFRVFRREILRNHSVYWVQIFRDNWNCYALSIIRVFILLASSDSDKHMLMDKKCKQRFPYWHNVDHGHN